MKHGAIAFAFGNESRSSGDKAYRKKYKDRRYDFTASGTCATAKSWALSYGSCGSADVFMYHDQRPFSEMMTGLMNDWGFAWLRECNSQNVFTEHWSIIASNYMETHLYLVITLFSYINNFFSGKKGPQMFSMTTQIR